ncbi:hypothetical protein [Oligoflexus tunisiensis]|uniref:hypothetical protein n=1 Tax=Oligoflexus tunisiensis TaxID=708132 RepID=UPI00114CDE9A|nr:hypothetical protein [Oligoflexus tunisiensis]
MLWRSLSQLALISWALCTQAEAATLMLSYGALEQANQKDNFYTLEAAKNQGELTDFEVISLNHAKGQTLHDSVEVLSRGLGVDFAILRLSADIGYLFSLDKYALDEVDYGISRSVLGLALRLDLSILTLHAFSRSYIPVGSATTHIDSFDLTFNPYPHQQSAAGITLQLGPLEIQGETGRLDNLKGRFDILGENFMLTLRAVTYGKAALVLKGGNNTLLRLEAHKVLQDHNRRSDFHKLIGSAIHRDAYDGGSLGIGFAF